MAADRIRTCDPRLRGAGAVLRAVFGRYDEVRAAYEQRSDEELTAELVDLIARAKNG